MSTKVKLGFSFVLLVLAACRPTPPVVAPPTTDAADALPAPTPGDPVDASPMSDCEAACLEIDRVGCTTEPDCARVMCANNADPRFVRIDTACLIRAMLPSDVAVCGVDCTPKEPSSLAHPL